MASFVEKNTYAKVNMVDQPPSNQQQQTSLELPNSTLPKATEITTPENATTENATIGNVLADSNPNATETVFVRATKTATWAGLTIFNMLERVGETVVSVLGLDDSRYQDVLDGMTEDEMRRARAVQAEREAEFERVRSIKELRQKSLGELAVMEEGNT